MDSERWQRLRSLYEQAEDLPAAERRAFLARECADDPGLLVQVERLLARTPDPTFLEPPHLPSEPEPEVGDRVGADFVIDERIGRGGMGVVYRARQESLGRDVALKILPWSQTLDGATVQRFQREARSVARLHHPGIVPVHVVGVHRDAPFFAMELLPQGDLAHALRRLRAGPELSDVPLPIPRPQSPEYLGWVAERIAELASALEHAHRAGVVHRDVKPQNILLGEDGSLKLTDFGIARDERLGAATEHSLDAGTPEYMSPEQARIVEAPIDHRTDVYSLGVVLYELLTLELPFAGRTTHEILRKIAKDVPRDVRSRNPRVPRDLAVITHKALARDPDRRYRRAADMEEDLRRFLRHEAIEARPPGAAERCARFLRRNRVGVSGIALAVVCAVGGGLWAESMARARRLSLAEDRLDAATASGIPVEKRSAESRTELRDALRALDELPGSRSERSMERSRRLHEELSAFAVAELAALRRTIEENASPGGESGSKQAQLGEALLRLAELKALFPEDEAIAAFASRSVFPEVSLSATDEAGQPIEARGAYRVIDPIVGLPGPESDLGPLPCTVPLEPRRYRFVVRFADGGSREFIRDLYREGSLTLVARHRAEEDSRTQDMVLVPAGTYHFSDDPAVRDNHRGRAFPVESFWIDRCEVSNGEYQRFLDAMDAAGSPWPRPKYWDGERPESWDSLPVVGVTWEDCRAFAEWRGKRLVTAIEWLLAARGTEHRRFPWGDEPARGRAVVGGDVLWPQDSAGQRAEYLRNAVAVDQMPTSATPSGILHLFGNVREFAEDHAVVSLRGVEYPYALERWVMGDDWRADPERDGLDCLDYTRIDLRSSAWYLGFRCAVGDGG